MLLPQSPRKNRIIGIPAKKSIAPVKRGRGRPPKSAMLAAAAQTTTVSRTGKTLTQANFISLKNPAREARSREGSAGLHVPPNDEGPVAAVAPNAAAGPSHRVAPNEEDLDPDFLSALPAELRKEVLEEHKRKKLQAFRLAVTRKQKAAIPPAQPPRPPQIIKVPRPSRPTFTTQKLSREKDLRAAMKDWVREFADEGPYAEDVEALGKYLRRVVLDERDLGKAVGVVKWVEWVVGEYLEDGVGKEGFARKEWGGAVERIKGGVRGAAGERGLRGLSFN
ncbi:deoxycytidyl transferase [Neocucurbitaria cava]|uniref:Deoxycytidyl transferase n=1 Tax=Neocucurbitaria cava TaxID=798079 RepID=A0A9W8YFI2_9PLEO|nr:deoxycytidyl transferase [Neocucurbitaria cava]